MINTKLTGDSAPSKVYGAKALEVLIELRNNWIVSTLAKSCSNAFFLKMWPRERFFANAGFATASQDRLLAYGKMWQVKYLATPVQLAAADYIGLSFRELPTGERIVLIKVWEKKHVI